MNTHSNSITTHRRTLAALIASGALLIGAALLLANPNNNNSSSSAGAPASAQRGAGNPASAGGVPGAKTRPPQAKAPAHPHTITAITTEPATLCARRPFLATATINPAADVSQVFIGGKAGSRVVLEAFDPGPLKLTATAYDAHGRADTHTIDAQVVACDDAPFFTVAHRVASADEDVVLFEATPVQGLEGNISWRWKFDDHHALDTSRHVSHAYRTRPQTSPSSTHVVTVTARDEKGTEATSYLSVELVNGEWALAQKGIWHMPVAAPRFPTITADHIEAELSLRNIDPSRAFEIDAIEVTSTSCAHPDKLLTRTFAPATVLSLATVKPGELLESVLTIPREDQSFEACRWSVELQGRLDEDSTRASAFVSFEQGAPDWIKPQLDREEIKRAFRARIEQANATRHIRADDLLPVVTPR